MAESIWSYEGDVAPQKESYFSDVPRTGSRISYTTPESRRYTAGVLAPAQAAIRQAEEEELKRRDDELVYQRNKAILEEGKAEAKLKADMLAMEGPLTARLAEIQPLIESDPLKAESDLSGLMLQNTKVVSSSEGIQLAFTQMANAIASSKKQKADLDSSLYSQLQTSVNAGNLTQAENFLKQISDINTKSEAANLINSAKFVGENKQAQSDATAKQKEDQGKQAANQKMYGAMFSEVKGMQPVEPTPATGGVGAVLNTDFTLKPVDKGKLELFAKKFNLNPKVPDKELYMSVYEQLIQSGAVDGTTIGGNVGEVIGTMTPSP